MNEIICEDCNRVMQNICNDSVDLTVTSPPYDELREYKGYSLNMKMVPYHLYNITKVGGVVVWVVSDQTINGSESGSSFRQALRFIDVGFRLYDTMIWLKPSPQAPTEGRYYDVFEYMFIFSKGKPKTLNLIADRVNKSAGSISMKETRSCAEDREYTGEKRFVADISRRFNVWDISRGCNEYNHPAVFPEQLAKDHILSWSNKGDVVFDPFCGSGTTLRMARVLGRQWIGCDISKEYCDMALERVMKPFQQEIDL